MKINIYYQFKPKTAFILMSSFLIAVFAMMTILSISIAYNEENLAAYSIIDTILILIPAGFLFWTIKNFIQKVKNIPTEFSQEENC